MNHSKQFFEPKQMCGKLNWFNATKT